MEAKMADRNDNNDDVAYWDAVLERMEFDRENMMRLFVEGFDPIHGRTPCSRSATIFAVIRS
jgi:hypothetical protein